MKKALKLIGKVLSAAITALLAILLCGNLYTIAARALTDELQPAVFGWSTAVVISGSMSGEIEVNDMVVIHREKSYDAGDIITFESGSRSFALIFSKSVFAKAETKIFCASILPISARR